MSTTSSASLRAYWPANGLAALLDFASGANRRAASLLVLISLLLFLPGFFQIPPVDRDEAYFAQATKQMIETGDYTDIRFQDDVRYRKPVGIYWLQAAVVRTASALGVPAALDTIWLYRIPSLVGAIGAVLATYWCALAFVSQRGAVLAALLLAASPLLGVEARLAKTDAVLLLTVVVAMGAMARVYLAPRRTPAGHGWRLPAVFWTALAAGILIKGPVILMVVGLAAATLSIIERSARWLTALRPLAGVVWLALLVLPWLVAIDLHVGNQFLIDSLRYDFLGKVTSGQDTHGAPPGLYLILFFATFFPGSIFAGMAAPAIWNIRRQPAACFLLAWLVPSWLVFELVATKLPHYVLPLYPAIAILIAGAIDAKVLSKRRWLRRGTLWLFIGPMLAGLAVVSVAVVLEHDLALLAWPFLAAGVVCGLIAWQMFEVDGAEDSLLRAIMGAIFMAFGVYGIVVPSLGRAFPSVALARTLHDSDCEHPVAVSTTYGEPSLVFLAGTDTHFADASGAADFLLQGGCHFAFIDAHQERAFALRAQAIGLRYDREQDVEGFNISNGRPVTIAVFESVGAP